MTVMLEPQHDPVDDAGDNSFPCSDPPPWTLGSPTPGSEA
jgi:hypothetical protein